MNFIFDGIKLILRSQVWWFGTRLCSPSTEQFAAFVATWHTTVGELLAWEREPKNTEDTYCGSKDGWSIGH